MKIETTLYVHRNILDLLNRGAAELGVSRTLIVKHLIQQMMSIDRRAYSGIKYQERDRKESWYRLHISLNEYEYEYCLDMRKFFKMSVSYILAWAVLIYLGTMIKKFVNGNLGTDNYRFVNYLYVCKIYDDSICWQIYWGIPQKLLH